MESSDHNATASPAPEGGARRSRSGRVSRAPARFSPEATAPGSAPAAGAGKRKRPNGHDDEDVENEQPAASSDDELSDIDVDIDGIDGDHDVAADEDDDDLPSSRPKKKRPSPANRTKKPAAKKPKLNGTAPSHAASLPSRPKKTARVVVSPRAEDGLYADIFGSGDSSDDVAGRWYSEYGENRGSAVTDLVNCVLLAAGCTQQVTEDDIHDPDNCENRIAELQSLYEDEQITDYPLISKSRTSRSFRSLLVDFFKSLINVIHETQALYEDEALMENIARWVATLSSSTLRPFRHTATTVALAMQTALVQATKKVDERITKTTQQLEAEKTRIGQRKDKASRDKLAAIQATLDEAEQHRTVCGNQMTDLFDTVFVHRYRDIDAKIRTECVEALGTWIMLLPAVYRQAEYLRYLAWMLSDLNASTRHEVLKQLARICKREAEKLGHFLDRFRPRLVEMATKDADVNVRVAAIAVIDSLRDSAMLEPDDVDAVGKLIFDSEVRIRKAVVEFFVGGVEDLIESKIEEIGGNEAIDEVFDQDPDEYDVPRKDWVNIKCLAESLEAYNAQEEEGAETQPPTLGIEIATEVIDPTAQDSRITLAAQVLYEKVPEISNWEILAGYLLYDHSVSNTAKSRKSRASEATFKAAVAPQGNQEAVLLEVLAAAVKVSLAQGADPDRLRKKHSRADGEALEGTPVHLADTIPRLLKKYGAEASTAAIVLRLHHYLDLEVFLQLRQDSSTYSRLLDEICTQFRRHSDSAVLLEVAKSLLEARHHEELQETVDRKIADLWQECISALRNADSSTELSVRGNLDANPLRHLITLLSKIGKLASIAACVDVLEAEGESDESRAPAIRILVGMVYRGRLGEINEAIDNIEDELTIYAIKCCHFYFMWKIHSLIKAISQQDEIPGEEIDRLSDLRRTYDANLSHTFSTRGGYDDLRLFATGNLCDLQFLCASVRQAVKDSGVPARYAGLGVLVRETEPGLVGELISIYDTAERLYAKRARKTLGDPAPEDEPLEEDMLSDDEAEADQERTDEGRRAAELRAERNLCDIAAKLVLMLRAKMVDQTGPRAGQLRRRLLRNQHRLGNNLKAVLAFLDDSKDAEAAPGPAKKKLSAKAKGKQPEVPHAAAATANNKGKQPLSEAIVVADDDDDDDLDDIEDPFEDDPPEEGTVEDLRRRELLDDPIIDDQDDDDDGGPAEANNDVESILGD